jgi:NADH:ubiquinone oxidoreductase subunit C
VEEGIAASIREELAGAVDKVEVNRTNRVSVETRGEAAAEVADWLLHFGFDRSLGVSGVDYSSEKRIEIVYFLSSYAHNDLKRLVLALKVKLDPEGPSLPTLTPVWASVNLFEREAHEMFGVDFRGHPNQQKLLLQDNWDGPPPLRKELKIPELA